CLNAMTGLGTMFINDTAKVRMARPVVRLALRRLLNRPRAAVLVQNLDDRAVMERLGVTGERIAVIPGSGVDIDAMMPLPEPTDPVPLAFVGRLVESKGIRTLLAAHERLGQRGRDIRLLIAGLPDAANPTSIPPREIEAWSRRPNVKVLGFVEDIAALWARAHIAVLPSYREGLPLTLLEAAPCGPPSPASTLPPRPPTPSPPVTHFLLPLDDTEALAGAIDRLALDPQLRRKFGKAGRELVELKFSSQR